MLDEQQLKSIANCFPKLKLGNLSDRQSRVLLHFLLRDPFVRPGLQQIQRQRSPI
jgi:hypothetical protein